jgi:hypothetical protein
MKRFDAANRTSGVTDEEEALSKRLVIFMGLIGPVMLVGLLLWIVHWDASVNARTVRQDYFPSLYVNAATAAENPVETF